MVPLVCPQNAGPGFDLDFTDSRVGVKTRPAGTCRAGESGDEWHHRDEAVGVTQESAGMARIRCWLECEELLLIDPFELRPRSKALRALREDGGAFGRICDFESSGPSILEVTRSRRPANVLHEIVVKVQSSDR